MILIREFLYMIFAFIAGIVLGMFFFGGLWYTVKKAVNAKMPALWFLGSFIIRVCIVMIGFYYIVQVGWQALIISVVGFIVARFVVSYITKSAEKKQTKKEISYEA